MFALLLSALNLLQNLYNTVHITLGMLLHYLGKLKIQIQSVVSCVFFLSRLRSVLSVFCLLRLYIISNNDDDDDLVAHSFAPAGISVTK